MVDDLAPCWAQFEVEKSVVLLVAWLVAYSEMYLAVWLAEWKDNVMAAPTVEYSVA